MMHLRLCLAELGINQKGDRIWIYLVFVHPEYFDMARAARGAQTVSIEVKLAVVDHAVVFSVVL